MRENGAGYVSFFRFFPYITVYGIDFPAKNDIIALKKGKGLKGTMPTVCPVCGTTIEDFRRTGLLGCANCYRVFRDEVFAVVQKTQKDTFHKGKKVDALLIQQERLKADLERALREQNYPEAERLQEQLKALKARSAEGQCN